MHTRHTMGQDWGGRNASNPAGVRRVSHKQVLDAAEKAGVEVRRGQYSMVPGSDVFYHSKSWTMWWIKTEDRGWLTMADTNYLAIQHIENLGRD